MGVVYNGNYPAFFEVARTELMRHFGLPYTEVEKQGYLLPLTELHCNYIRPAEYDDVISIEAELDLSILPRIKFIYNIFRESTTIASGFTTHIFVQASNMKPVKPPKFFNDTLLKINQEI